jgi:formylglycine-generating enzyme required for sulfatase activity
MPNKFAAGDKMLKHEQIQITLSPFQLEYISKMEAHGYSREEVIHRALNELMAKDDKVSGCHLPIGEYSQQKNNNMILVEGGSIAPIPSFQAVLSSFWLSRYPVTQAEFKEVMGITPSHDFGWVPAIQHITLAGQHSRILQPPKLKDGLTPCYSYKGFGVNPDDWPEGWDQG